MTRIYEVVKTQWGFDIVGPNNHRWVCGETENRSRVTAMAKALDRAYVEGAAGMTSNPELLHILNSLSRIEDRPDPDMVAALRRKATNVLREVERLNSAAAKTKKDRKAEGESAAVQGESSTPE